MQFIKPDEAFFLASKTKQQINKNCFDQKKACVRKKKVKVSENSTEEIHKRRKFIYLLADRELEARMYNIRIICINSKTRYKNIKTTR